MAPDRRNRIMRLSILLLAVAISGCGAAVAVVDTAVGVAGTAVETTVDVTAGAVDLAIPDDDD
jgi:uncharacterized protein YceK